jgi:hypothetical protein
MLSEECYSPNILLAMHSQGVTLKGKTVFTYNVQATFRGSNSG